MEKTNISNVIGSIEKLIADKNLVVIAHAGVAVCIDSLWKAFVSTEDKHTFIRNLALYCQLKNSYDGKENVDKTILTIKTSGDKILEVWKFDGKKIEFKIF